MNMVNPPRCTWPKNELAIAYHDQEWGVPVFNDQKHFEFLTLEGAQAGLSWDTVLRKREAYRQAFCRFDFLEVSRFGENDIERLMQDPGIIRNRAKIAAAIHNARLFLEIQKEYGTFSDYIWKFVNGRPILNVWDDPANIPAITPEAENLSKDLKRRGFKFVGPTVCYAHMQAAGLVNDHLVSCFRHVEVQLSDSFC